MFEPWLLGALLALLVLISLPGQARPCAATVGRLLSPWWLNRMELRVDVQLGTAEVDEELKALHERLEGSGLLQNGCQVIQTRFPELVFHHREADGEHYLYVEDVARGCLAGYTVFNRLIEVNRRIDRYVRAPHSKYAAAYQRRGIASAVYEWALGQGLCLISGARQSPGANALWRALAQRHRLEYIEIRDKAIQLLESPVDKATQDSLQTRMLLLGAGWEVEAGQLSLVRDGAGKEARNGAGNGAGRWAGDRARRAQAAHQRGRERKPIGLQFN